MDPFAAWCREHLFTPRIVRAEAIQQEYCDRHLAGLAERLALPRLLSEPRTAAGLASELRFFPSAAPAVEAMLDRLARRGRPVERIAAGGLPRYRWRDGDRPPATGLPELRGEMAALGPDFLAGLDFLDFGAARFLEALREDEDLMDRVLSGRDAACRELWDRATNVDPLQDLHGRMGARAVQERFEGGVVLEVGGGTGNGMRHLLATLEEVGRLDRIERYLFTDVSLPFLLVTRRAMRARHPGLRCDWRYLDINRPFPAQRIGTESLDLIYGVNAAHVARDIVGFLKQCRRSLRPGGRVLFAERVRLRPREMAPRELTLNLSLYHRTAAIRDGEIRPVHCYLSPEGWRRAVEVSGLAAFELLPPPGDLRPEVPNPYAVVVSARRPA